MNEEFENNIDSQNDILDSFDKEKLLHILKKSLIYILFFFIASLAIAYLVFVRWTKPVYESESLLKLDVQSEATALGLSNVGTINIVGMSGEIEILRSDLFLSIVVDEIDMDISYFYYGSFLEDERYHNSPFKVSHNLKDHSLYDQPIDITIQDATSFILSYTSGGETYSAIHKFGEEIDNDRVNFLLEKSYSFDSNAEGNYYFIVNSKGRLISSLRKNLTVKPENFNANTIRISFTDYNKYKARDLVQAIDTLYLDFTRKAKNKAVEQKIEFLEDQISLREDKLYDYENYFESFIIDNRTQNLSGDIGQSIGLLNALDSQEIKLKRSLLDAEFLSNNMDMDSSLLSNGLFSLRLSERLKSSLFEFQRIREKGNDS